MCGDPDEVGLTVACPKGHYVHSFPARCKGRGFCAYCLTLRQRELAAQLIKVIGNVPVLHAVLCFPPSLRGTLGYDAKLISGGFAALAGALSDYQRRRGEELFGVSRERIHAGCVAVHHDASANLDPNNHFHGLIPAGVFIEVEPGKLEFRRLPAPSEEDVARVAYEAGLSFCAALKARGFWEPQSVSEDVMEGLLKLPGRVATRAKYFGEAAKFGEGGKRPRNGAYAFHLHISKAIEEPAQLQDLIRYVLAPPFRDDQVEWDGSGRVRFRLRRQRHDGTDHVSFTPAEFLNRLAELVPRPNTNRVRYYGIYGARARLRKQALAIRLEGRRGVEDRLSAGVKECPVCGERLRVIPGGKAHRGSPARVPPDTPHKTTPGGMAGRGQSREQREQGRLFG